VITEVRAVRAQKSISPREQLSLYQKGTAGSYFKLHSIIEKLANVELKEDADQSGPGASFIVGTLEFSIPLEGLIDSTEEIEKLEEELKYQQGFLQSVQKKLSNERFVNNAPAAVVEAERKKMADAESRIRSIENQLSNLK